MENTEFKWDDATVKEMIWSKLPIPEHYTPNLQKCLDEFKASKKNSKEVLFITEDGYNVVDKETDIYAASKKQNYSAQWDFKAKNYQGFNDVKYFFKKENRDRWVEQNTTKKPDYEILSYYWDGRIYYKEDSGKFRCKEYPSGAWSTIGHEDGGNVINSVRRNSDGEVFARNEVCQDEVGHIFKPIKKFFINEGIMYAQFDEGHGSNDGCLGVNCLIKYTKKQPVFTANGVDYYEGDEWFLVNNYFEIIGHTVAESHRFCNNHNRLIFKTKQLAEDFVFLKKPVTITFDELFNYSPDTKHYSKFYFEFFRNKTLGGK